VSGVIAGVDVDGMKALVRRLEAAGIEGDVTELDEHPGYWQMRQVMPRIRRAFPDMTTSVQRQVAEGELVASFSILSGTHLGRFMGIPPTGRHVDLQHVTIDRVREGRVVEHNGESGWLGVLVELGILPRRRAE
jgi:predicted ester cyclase